MSTTPAAHGAATPCCGSSESAVSNTPRAPRPRPPPRPPSPRRVRPRPRPRPRPPSSAAVVATAAIKASAAPSAPAPPAEAVEWTDDEGTTGLSSDELRRVSDVRRGPRRRGVHAAAHGLALLSRQRPPRAQRQVEEVVRALRRRDPHRLQAHVAHQAVPELHFAPTEGVRHGVVGAVLVRDRQRLSDQGVRLVAHQRGVQQAGHRRRPLARHDDGADQRVENERRLLAVEPRGEALKVDDAPDELQHDDRQLGVLLDADVPHELVQVAAQRRFARADDGRVGVHDADEPVAYSRQQRKDARQRRHRRRVEQPVAEPPQRRHTRRVEHQRLVQAPPERPRAVQHVVDRVHLRVWQAEDDDQVVEQPNEANVPSDGEDALERRRDDRQRVVHLVRPDVTNCTDGEHVAANERGADAQRALRLVCHEDVET
eukprot:scaffold95069_cov65-Phaeocystis_antarctica.AAC.1